MREDEHYFILLSLFVIIMPFQLQHIDFNDIIVDVINYSVMSGYMSRPCNTVTTLQSFWMSKPNPWMLYQLCKDSCIFLKKQKD